LESVSPRSARAQFSAPKLFAVAAVATAFAQAPFFVAAWAMALATAT